VTGHPTVARTCALRDSWTKLGDQTREPENAGNP
jgi:hypothetical protein